MDKEEYAMPAEAYIPVREAEAAETVLEAFDKAARPAVAFGGGKESVVLLHLVKSCLGGTLKFPAVCSDPPAGYSRVCYFVEKMRRLWGFELVRIPGVCDPVDEGGSGKAAVYPGMAGLVVAAGREYGFSTVFTGLRRDEEGVSGELTPVMEYGGVTVVNPLAYFAEEDVWSYINRHGLPVCSLYREAKTKIGCLRPVDGLYRPAPVSAGAGEEDEELKRRLRMLGYL